MLVFNEDHRILLFKFSFDNGALAGRLFWGTPGGALHKDESYADATRRELKEETGIAAEIDPEMAQRQVTFKIPEGVYVDADERFFPVHVKSSKIDQSGQEPLEASVMIAYRWWTLDELRSTTDTVYPKIIVKIVEDYLND